MEILDSLEVRWFLPSNAPAGASLERWFGAARDEGERVDHYLATRRADLSFKARLAKEKPAKVETKYLVGSLGIVDLAPQMSGELQRWRKLSLALDDPALRRDGAWLAVAKRRRLRKFAVASTEAPTASEVSPDAYPPIGCGVELTRLDYSIDGTARVEWTFGLEAFGPSAGLLDVLQAAVRVITARSGLPNLPAAWTASYASWLLSRLPVDSG
jgi:hypothetical protein